MEQKKRVEMPECSHNESYKCPRCGECFPCKHKLLRPFWKCRDGMCVRTNCAGKIIEVKYAG